MPETFGLNRTKRSYLEINAKPWNDSILQEHLSQHRQDTAGVRNIRMFFDKKPIRDPYLIIKDGQLAGIGAIL